jgi:hypothetical protein
MEGSGSVQNNDCFGSPTIVFPFPSLHCSRPVQERVEESAEAAEERHPHEDDRRDGHQGQRVRGFLPQTRAAHGHFREGLGETLPHPGGQHPSGPGWQVRWCGQSDVLYLLWLGETLPHPGGQHPGGPGWQVRWCGHSDVLPSMVGRNPPPSRRPASQWPWLAGTFVWSF